MANMVFAPRNASVIEFAMQPHVDRCFGYMAAALGIDYWLFPQMAAFYYGKYEATDSNIATLVKLVKHILHGERRSSLNTEDLRKDDAQTAPKLNPDSNAKPKHSAILPQDSADTAVSRPPFIV